MANGVLKFYLIAKAHSFSGKLTTIEFTLHKKCCEARLGDNLVIFAVCQISGHSGWSSQKNANEARLSPKFVHFAVCCLSGHGEQYDFSKYKQMALGYACVYAYLPYQE